MLTNRPRTRQRAYKKPPALDVPNIDEDAAERKRVLNVLAQRRYREKKRLDRLKTKSAGSNRSQNSEPQDETVPNPEGRVSKDDVYEIPTLRSNLESTIPEPNLSIPPTTDADILAGFDLNLTSWNPLGDPLQDLAFAPILPDPNTVPRHLGGDLMLRSIVVRVELWTFRSSFPPPRLELQRKTSEPGFKQYHILVVTVPLPHNLPYYSSLIQASTRHGHHAQLFLRDELTLFSV
ncbi:hypothetical protein FVER53590_04125 [Fusarium verticillioides]|nr:hypothetical protein FVER53590_04125 [Fusarium verticillioides]